MKIKNTLSVILFLLIPVIISCEKEISPGLDKSLAAPAELQYEEENSTDSEMSFIWDGEAAMSQGAVSFTVEMLKSKLGIDAVPIRSIVLANNPINDGVRFDGLKKGQKYFVRARANYTKARYSDWTWVMNNDTIGVVKVGSGPVNESIDVLQTPSLNLSWASSKALALKFSTTAFADHSVDIKYDYKIELYKDADCKYLQVAMDIPASVTGTRKMAIMPDYFPGMVFSGLTPNTTYWCKVTCYDETRNNITGKTYSFTTLEDNSIDVTELAASSAEPGDVILFETFDDLAWGGDMVYCNAGISRKDRSSMTSFISPTGDRTGENAMTSKEVTGDFNFCAYNNEYGLYNSLGKAVRGSSPLGKWGQLHEHSGAATGTLVTRPGMLKIGASSKLGIIVTPELAPLKRTATIKIKFKACNYNEEATGVYDTPDKALYVYEDLTWNPNTNYFSEYYITHEAEQKILFKLENETKGVYGWMDYEFTIEHVKPTSRIGIGGTRDIVGTGQNRFYLDNVQIEVVSYEN